MTDNQIEARETEIRNAAIERNGGSRNGYTKHVTPEECREFEELSARRMVNSIACYHGLRISEYDRKNYFVMEDKMLGKDKVDEIIADQIEFFKNHAKVHREVFVDDEGCTYNSIEWDCE